MADLNVFTVGGVVQANNGLYIPRRADEELLELCRAGGFAYILTSRQLGKSSLMIRTVEQLAQEGTRSVIIDLSQIGVLVSAEQWYKGFLVKIEEELSLDTNVFQWWAEHGQLGPAQRLTLFFEEVLLKEVAEPVVIFVDEIDTTLSLNFTDDFFAAIRYAYQARAHKPQFKRLSFVLIGVATPGDLIRDPLRTPFNIAQRVDLTDFTFKEAQPLTAGFDLPPRQSKQVLLWVMKWTHGHPYLTQRLCQAVARAGRPELTEADIDRVVAATFLGENSQKDSNLQSVRDMLTKRSPDPDGCLETYLAIRRGHRAVPDEEQSLLKSHLKLSGIVRRDKQNLRVRNRVYERVFDPAWVKSHMTINWPRRLQRAAAAAVALFLLALLPLSAYAFYTRERAVRQKEQLAVALGVVEQREKALAVALKEAKDEKQKAIAAGEETEKERQKAEAARKEAVEQRAFAEQQKAEADRQRLIAENKSREAQKHRDTAELERARALASESAALSAMKIAQLNFEKAEKARKEAEDARVEAERLQKSQEARQLMASAELIKNRWPRQHTTGLLLAVEAEGVTPETQISEAQSALSDMLTIYPLPPTNIKSYAPAGDPETERRNFKSSLFLSENGGRLLTYDQRTRETEVWDVGESISRRLAIPPVEEASARILPALSRDGAVLAYQKTSTSVMVQDVEKGTVRELPHPAPTRVMALSSDGKYLATVTGSQTVWVWDTFVTQPPRSFTNVMRVVRLAVSPDGRHVAMIDSEGTVWVKDVSKPDPLPVSPSQVDRGIDVSFSPDGKYLAVTTSGNTTSGKWVKVWDVAKGNEFFRWPVQRRVFRPVFAAQGQYLSTITEDYTVQMWDFTNGKEVVRINDETDSLMTATAFDKDGESLITAASSNVIKVKRWAVTPRGDVERFEHGGRPLRAVALDAKTNRLVTVTSTSLDSGFNVVQSWDVKNDNKPVDQRLLPGQYIAAISADGTHAAAADPFPRGTDGENNIALVRKLSTMHTEAITDTQITGRTALLTLSYEGRYLATLNNKVIRVWDTGRLKEVGQKILEADTKSFVLSAEGQYLAATLSGNTIRVWKRRPGGAQEARTSGGLIRTVALQTPPPPPPPARSERAQMPEPDYVEVANLPDNYSASSGLAISPDGKYLAAGGSRYVYVWEIAGDMARQSEEPVLRIPISKRVTALAFDHTGNHLAVAVRDLTVPVWSVPGRQMVASFRLDEEATTAAFARREDKEFLLTGDSGGVVRVWPLKREERILRDGPGGVVRAWLLKREEQTDEACERLTRNLTWDEWREFIGETVPYRKTCQNLDAHPSVLQWGEELAWVGGEEEIKLATDIFNNLRKLGVKLQFDDSEKHARRLAAEARAARLMDEGKKYAEAGELQKAAVKFREALSEDANLKINPEAEALRIVQLRKARDSIARSVDLMRREQDKVRDALAAYAEAERNLADYDEDVKRMIISADSLNSLCWWGSLWGQAGDVIGICEKAVALRPSDWNIRDSRGVARAMTGNYQGAIEDFQGYIEHAPNSDERKRRQDWVEILKRGQNPITDEVRKTLRGPTR